jgi:hypothetical protein
MSDVTPGKEAIEIRSRWYRWSRITGHEAVGTGTLNVLASRTGFEPVSPP